MTQKRIIMQNAKKLHLQLQPLVRNRYFELFMMGIIIFSALLVGINTFHIEPIYMEILLTLDIFISIIFVIEIVLRIASYKKPLDFFKDGWNIFDFLVITLSLVPIDGNNSAVARLLRIFRILRIITILPELRVMITALFKSAKSISFVMILMFIIFYIYAIVGTVFFEEAKSGLWNNVGTALLTLFRIMTFEGWTEVMYESMEIYPLSWIFYLSFIFLTTFTFLNMIIGIILDTLNAEHKIEDGKIVSQEYKLLEKLEIQNQILMQKIEQLENKIKQDES